MFQKVAMQKRVLFFSLIIFFNFSCRKSNDVFYAEDVVSSNNVDLLQGPYDYLATETPINISVNANGNYPGVNDLAFIKNISGSNHSYYHPEVQYFPNGFNGYKYWMVFTPFGGAVGTYQISKRYENPTVVVSNNGISWTEPSGIKNPLAMAPDRNESFAENKVDTIQGYWSDPDWVFTDNMFNLYYRGSMITAKALKQRGADSQNNTDKLKTDAQRTIVRQTSTDGVNWTKLEVAYNSNPPYTPKNSLILSPSFINVNGQFVSYEVELNTGTKNFRGNELSYIIRRTSKDGLNFTKFTNSQVINFSATPWKDISAKNAPWHIHATYVDGYYFLCIAAGDVKKSTADLLYLAYSSDGLNFKVLSKPLIDQNAYRSAIFPMATSNNTIQFGAIFSYKTGEFKYKEFKISKSYLDDMIAGE